MKRMESDVATKDELIQSIRKSGSLSHTRFFYKKDTYLEILTRNVKRFGEVVTETKPNDIPFAKQRGTQAQMMIPLPAKSINDLTLTLVFSVNTHSNHVRG